MHVTGEELSTGWRTERNRLGTERNGLRTEHKGLRTECKGLRTEHKGLKNTDIMYNLHINKDRDVTDTYIYTHICINACIFKSI